MNQYLIDQLKLRYGIICEQITPVSGGWLNLKWKVTCQNKDYLVKQYSRLRFNISQLERIEESLQRQTILQKNGFPCPMPLSYNGRIIQELESSAPFMVMTFSEGVMETPKTITSEQMESLGCACGQIHKAFRELPEKEAKGYPIKGHMLLEELWSYHHKSLAYVDTTPNTYRIAVMKHPKILNELSSDYLDHLPKGICHEDFTPDNMLFFPDRVSAILDFDRSQYSFQWHDVGRALLSLALEDGVINREKVDAFFHGYSAHMPMERNNIADALRVCWIIEAPWWILPGCFSDETSTKVQRFRDELLWVTAHWEELDDI